MIIKFYNEILSINLNARAQEGRFSLLQKCSFPKLPCLRIYSMWTQEFLGLFQFSVIRPSAHLPDYDHDYTYK